MTEIPPFIIGLTGSIGMGKTTTARMFADEGIPVWDADEAVERLYSEGGAAIDPIAELHPPAIVNNAVNREALRRWIAGDKTALERIERVVHPLVAADRTDFLGSTNSPIVILDIPLLFETGLDAGMDLIVVVSVPEDVQRTRVLQRQGMTEAQFELILSKQTPDEEKRACADVVISTQTLKSARAGVRAVIEQVREQQRNA